MSTIKKTTEENDQLVKETYQDIRDTRKTEYVGNFWKYLAFDPSLLKEVWTDVKNVMTKETLIDKKTKEMIYMAVSITNNCSYCTHSHTASAKKLGMSDEEHSEFLRIVALAAKTNQLVNGLQVPVDEIFDADK
ncbi:alkylhydroperoxidase AhpD family core domain protein [alpha proteobacterium HIMB59]|nr:alkylhydroperoxidase AhpD family core domain protein [alpha proteobacterium HIMB59]